MKNTAKKIMAAALAVTTIFGSGMAASSAGLVKASPMAVTASAEENQKTYKVDGITYVCEMRDKGMAIISAEGDFPDDYTIPTKLGNVNIKVIGHNAFAETNIRNITIPDSIVDIAFNAFVDCLYLDTVYFNASNCEVNTLTYAGITRPFMGSTVNTVYFGKDVTNVPDDLFDGAGNLENVYFEDEVSRIGNFAFCNCTSLKGIDESYLSSLTEIGEGAFANTDYRSFIAPKTLRTIGGEAFANTKISKLDLGSVTKIGLGAFKECNGLKEVTIPSTLKERHSLGSQAFADCKGLKTVYFNANETSNGDLIEWGAWDCNHSNVFAGSAVEKVIFGDNVTHIPHNALDSYDAVSALKEVYFNGKIEYIDSDAFYACSSIKDIYFLGTEAEWAKVVIMDGNDYLKNANIHFNNKPEIETNKVISAEVNDVTLNYKNSAKVTPDIETIGNPKYTVRFESSNTKVATVDNNGNVKANGTGSAVITCTVTDTNGNIVMDTCKVNVTMTWWQWVIKIVLFGWIWY